MDEDILAQHANLPLLTSTALESRASSHDRHGFEKVTTRAEYDPSDLSERRIQHCTCSVGSSALS